MKNFIIFLIAVLSCLQGLKTQWLADYQLSTEAGSSLTSSNNGKSIAAIGDTVITVWSDIQSGSNEILCRRSFNGGQTWFNVEKIAGAIDESFSQPSITAYQNTFYVIYIKQSSGTSVQLSKTTNGGVVWTGITVSDHDDQNRQFPSIACYGNYIHVTWHTSMLNTLKSIQYARSTNNGSSFATIHTWGSAVYDNQYGSFAVNGPYILLVFLKRHQLDDDIVYLRSTNTGETFTTLSMPPLPDINGSPSAASSGTHFYVAWADWRNGDGDIYFRRSSNNGETWMMENRLTSNSSTQEYPSVYAVGTNIHLVWEDYRDSTEIYYLSGINYGNTWQSTVRLTENVYSSIRPSAAANGNMLHVIWSDRRNGNKYKAFYKRNPSGNAIGLQHNSLKIPAEFMLEQNFPNPFNPMTNISFDVPKTSLVNLAVYDLLGRKIETLVAEELSPGSYSLNWNAARYSSGIYFCKLSAGSIVLSKLMILVK